MGQYHKWVNLTKREYINPHWLGDGAKAWEQLANGNCGRALVVLMTCPEKRGGGDLEPNRYVGRWHGDRVVMVGDYAEDSDFDTGIPGVGASELYSLCSANYDGTPPVQLFVNVSDGVCSVIEHELDGKFVGEGWRDFERNGQSV